LAAWPALARAPSWLSPRYVPLRSSLLSSLSSLLSRRALPPQLAAHLPQKLPDDAKYSEPHIKALVLLQCHYSRTALPTDLHADLDAVLGDALRLLQALVDVISSNGWLKVRPLALSREIEDSAARTRSGWHHHDG
jgi:hypothetical protein